MICPGCRGRGSTDGMITPCGTCGGWGDVEELKCKVCGISENEEALNDDELCCECQDPEDIPEKSDHSEALFKKVGTILQRETA